MDSKHLTYLALGDSYTIGEGVPVYENFPYQLVQMLRESGVKINAPEIVAKTGWTTFELSEHLDTTLLSSTYDFVTLLIGVNNQYRSLPVLSYKPEFEELLKRAIKYAGNEANKVIVVSIPHWGFTPFAAGRDRQKTEQEIDHFNSINRDISTTYKVKYVDISPGSKAALNDETLVTDDKLHPSGKEYKRWAEMIRETMEEILH